MSTDTACADEIVEEFGGECRRMALEIARLRAMTAAPERRPDHIEDARVLIVDDNPVNRHMMRVMLAKAGVTAVQEAVDGVSCLDCLPTFPPDVIVLDLLMPNLDGFEVCRRLRADVRWRDIPVAIVSSLGGAKDRIQAYEAGANDYITKPLDPRELILRIRHLLRLPAGVQAPG